MKDDQGIVWERDGDLLTLYIHKEEQTPPNPACSQTAQLWTRKKKTRRREKKEEEKKKKAE